MTRLISMKNVARFFEEGSEKNFVLRDINLEINESEFVSVMGPSGSGKSTLLSIMGMLDNSWSGEYQFMGQDVRRLKPKDRAELHRRHVGFVFQSYHLIDNLTVAQNVEVPLSYQKMSSSERRQRVAEVLERFQLTDRRDVYPSRLSGGHQQLVGLARAVVIRPKVLLADEPTGNLHSGQAKDIMDLFRTLNLEGTTIVQVTHSEFNASYGNRILKLFDGMIENDDRRTRSTSLRLAN